MIIEKFDNYIDKSHLPKSIDIDPDGIIDIFEYYLFNYNVQLSIENNYDIFLTIEINDEYHKGKIYDLIEKSVSRINNTFNLNFSIAEDVELYHQARYIFIIDMGLPIDDYTNE